MKHTPNQRAEIEAEMIGRRMQRVKCRHCVGGCIIRVEREFTLKRICTNCSGEGFNWIQAPKICPPLPDQLRSPAEISNAEKAL